MFVSARGTPYSNIFRDITVIVVAILAVSDELAVGHDFSRVIGSRHGPPDDQVHGPPDDQVHLRGAA